MHATGEKLACIYCGAHELERGEEEYLCLTCGKTLPKGFHSVHHEQFPHVEGDESNLY